MKIIYGLFLLFCFNSFAHELPLDPYLKMHKALISEDLKGALEAHQYICDKELIHYKDEYKDCDKKFSNLAELRSSFKKLSALYIENAAKSDLKDVLQGYCPMEKASWLQRKGKVENPFVDKSMATCGSLK